MLGLARMALWLVPLVGAVQTALPILSRFRRYAGFLGLVGRFAFGLLFVLLALVPLLGAPESQLPLIGGALMIAGGVFGVTRGNFLFVYLAQAGIVAAVVYAITTLAGR